jgi:hypothetical protein
VSQRLLWIENSWDSNPAGLATPHPSCERGRGVLVTARPRSVPTQGANLCSSDHKSIHPGALVRRLNRCAHAPNERGNAARGTNTPTSSKDLCSSDPRPIQCPAEMYIFGDGGLQLQVIGAVSWFSIWRDAAGDRFSVQLLQW